MGADTLRHVTAAVLAVLALLTGALTLLGVDTPVRLYLTVAFVILAPGWALTSYLHIVQPALVWSVSVGVGVALAILVAQVMVSAGFWHPWAAMLGMEALTVVLLAHHLVRWRRARARHPVGVSG